ncbi:MAG: uridine kinase, partial [Lachnospiraceae bacterium]|nr:uridine kinase [Lachnospiraceae bacterium]
MGFRIRNTPRNRGILIGLAVIFKLLLMGLFSSDYQDRMFIPFVETFLSGHNPYQYYYDNSLLYSFPYMPLMLLTESVGGALLMAFNTGSVFLQNLIFKLPLLAFDLIGYFFYRKMNVRFKYVYIFYFLSPVILYSTYVHGQLDIIPTTLLVIAVYFMTCWRKKYNLLWCGLFLGLALSAKL